jgi:DegV family protein with EDD domain
MIKIIVDSSTDLPAELLKEYDIRLIPQRIYLEGVEYFDKVTIDTDEVYEAMRRGITPMTSIPRPVDVKEAFVQCCRREDDFIYIAISSKLSGTYQLAMSILEEVKEEYREAKMQVVDSKSGSTAAGLIALQAAKLARAGVAFEEIVEQLTELADHVEHVFFVGDLKWLVMGGRLTRSDGLIGNILNIKPILHVRDGEVELLERVRGRKKALTAIVDIVEDKIKDFPKQTIGISHAGDLELVDGLREMLIKRLGLEDIITNKIGAALVSHLGIGGVGVFFFNKEPRLYIE